jgi:GxxExxY protein
VEINELTELTIGAAIMVHRELGPGLMESAYERCLEWELVQRGLLVERQKALPVRYRDVLIDCGYRIDLLIDKTLVIELKVVERLTPIDMAQMLTYLRLGHFQIGLLMNFNVELLKDGIRRVVLGLPEPLQRTLRTQR